MTDSVLPHSPGQLAYLANPGTPCGKPGCLVPRCPGSTAAVQSNGDVIFSFMHSKTGGHQDGAIIIHSEAETVTAQVWAAYITAGHPLLRDNGKGGSQQLLLSNNGQPLTEKAVGTLATRALAAAGFPKATSRTARRAVVVHAMQTVDPSEHEAIARQMGNSCEPSRLYLRTRRLAIVILLS